MTFKELEIIRKTYQKKVSKLYKIFIIIGAVLSAAILIPSIITCIRLSDAKYLLFAIFPIFFIATILIIIAVLATHITASKDYDDYKKAYKAYFVSKSLASTFVNLTYSRDAGLPKEILDITNMIDTGDYYDSNDFVSGEYKDVSFVQADVCIKKEEKSTDSNGNTTTTYVTTFKGRWMIFEFPKKFDFRLEIASKDFVSNRVPGSTLSKTTRKFQKIAVESIDFNKQFEIYAEDGMEAFYILDPAFIEKIQKLKEDLNAPILLCFIDSKLHVGVCDKKDAFEPPKPSKPIDEKAEFKKVNTDIKVITKFIDNLNLNKKIFKK